MKQQTRTTDGKIQGNVITHTFNASREEVWKALTDPEWLKRWWGPKNFTAPFMNSDLQLGGKYLYSMKSPDGRIYWSTGVFKEVDPPNRLVFSDSFADVKGNVISPTSLGFEPSFPMETEVDIVLEDQNGKTKLTLTRQALPSEKDEKDTAEGWNESFEKMEHALEESKVGAR